ncbi:MAG: cysteine--tRNA ligase [SAR202 cluster bacterium]|nr:cysteine--tRNA ligase [SAR202 cluster bacterium]
MKLYSTLSGTMEPLIPIADTITLYVCGLTPYSEAHVGHAMRAVIFDVLRRYLEYQGHDVKHVENVTDIDDKMIARAAEEDITVKELSERNMKLYMRQMALLNVLPAHIYPKATEEIPTIIEMIQRLETKGIAYDISGDVYFRVRLNKDYGKLSHRTVDGMRAGARMEIDKRKEDSMDFALWKSQKPDEPAWDSPWGKGRPGWHIECSAMVSKYLGNNIDIHGGGQDLIFPHHENEIAQTESFSDQPPMARFWVHNGMVQLGEDKMSKSLGNIVSLQDAFDSHSPNALRLFFLNSHYRSPLIYREDILESQERALERLQNALEPSDSTSGMLDVTGFEDRFVQAMDDDLNTPRALAVLFDLRREINRARDDNQDVTSAQSLLAHLGSVLGLQLDYVTDNSGDVAPLVELLIKTRAGLRSAKQFEAADHIRDRLTELGYTLEDTPGDTTWKRS